MNDVIIGGAFNDFVEEVERGMEGKNTFIPTGFPKLDQHIGLGQAVYILVGGESGTGKCLGKGTKIIMSDGSLKKVEDIQKGDLVMGMDSTPRKVGSVTTGKEQMYWIRQKNGKDYRVNASHLVALRYNRKGKRCGDVSTYTAEDLYNEKRVTFFNYYKGFKVPIDFRRQEVPIEPYLLGLWLGDGSSHKLQISTEDSEIKEYLYSRLKDKGVVPTTASNGNKSEAISLCYKGTAVRNVQTQEVFSTRKEALKTIDNVDATNISQAIKLGTKAGGYNWEDVDTEDSLREQFNSLNLLNNKHIPNVYFANSRKVRLRLLAGLVDSDGTKDPRNNSYSISTSNKEFAEEVGRLVRSLGMLTSVTPRTADVKTPDGRVYKDYKSYRISFTAVEDLPCKVRRKMTGRLLKKETLSTGITVEKDIVDTYYGFTLEGKDKFFLLEDCTVTHNTALTDTMFVLNPYKWYMENRDKTDKKLRIIYRSMERSKTRKIAKWVCRKLWLDHNILVDVPTVLGWRQGKKKIPRDVFQQLVATRDYFEEMFDVVQITDGAVNPTGVYKQCRNISLAEGFLLKSDSKEIKVYSKKFPKGKIIKSFTMEKFKVNKGGTKIFYEEVRVLGETKFIPQYHTEYFPKQENLINVILGDHNGKWKNERGYSEKQTLDKASDYYGELRDIYKWSPIAVNQFNRNIAETTRRVKLDLTPEKQDFKGSGNMYEDSDFVCAIFNPSESGMKEFKGIKVGGFTNKKGFNRFRTLHILKNSYGIDNITTGLNFIGECGHFQEIKESPKEMMAHHYAKYADVTQQPPNLNKNTTVLV